MGKQAKKRKPYLRLKCQIDPSDYRAIDWYRDARELIVREYGKDARLFIGLLAATSPRKQVKANFRLSDDLLKAYRNRADNPAAFGDLLGSLMPAHRINVLRVLAGKELSGQKVKAFYANLLGDLSVCTIDIWICLAYGLDQKKLSALEYKRLSYKMKKEADKIGLQLAEYQALVWTAIRREAGKSYKSFVAAWNDLCQPLLWD
jgi:hypothetical protein